MEAPEQRDISELSLEEIKALIDTNWPWPLSAVQEWFENLWNTILELAQKVWDWMEDALWPIFQWIYSWLFGFLINLVPEEDRFLFPMPWLITSLHEFLAYSLRLIPYAIKGMVLTFFDWLWTNIKDAFTAVTTSITEFFSNLWTNIVAAFAAVATSITDFFKGLWENIEEAFAAVATSLTTFFGDLWTNITEAFAAAATSITDFFKGLWENIEEAFATVSTWFSDLWSDISEGFGKIPAFFKEHIEDPLADFVEEWISKVTGFFGSLWSTIWQTMNTWWTVVMEFFTEDMVPGIMAGFKWISDWFAEAIDSVMDSVFGWLKSHSPLTPEDAPGSAVGLMTILGFSGIGLALMTAAGQLMHPLAAWKLGHVSTMIGDIINYRQITGVIMGTVISSAIGTPLRYYVNDLLRPWIFSQRDFFELMSREAFTHPESLRTPGLVEAVQSLPGGGGGATEAQYIGYYGYPKEYHPVFRELANARLGYFPLAGIARTGWWDPEWFEESVQRTGYSVTARRALMGMYEEMVRTSKLGPCFFQLRRLFRDHFITSEERAAHIDNIDKLPDLPLAREYAMDLEREYELKVLMEDIITRSFTKGVITEAEAIAQLRELGLPDDIATLEMVRERLGVMKRITIEAPPPLLPPEVIEIE